MRGELNEKFQTLLDRFNRSPESRIFAPLADAYRKKGDVEKAIKICEQGLQRFPDYASARVILGKCYYDNGASERSKTEFERVLELDSENMVALKFLGDIFFAEDNKEKAAGYYNELLSIDPKNKEVKKFLDQLSEEFIPKSIDLNDDKNIERTTKETGPTTMTLAGIYAAQGYYSRALEVYEGVLKKDPGNREASGMIKQIKARESAKESEREKAFSEDAMTISLDDISDEIVENTSGVGGKKGVVEKNVDGRNEKIDFDDGEAVETAEELERRDSDAEASGSKEGTEEPVENDSEEENKIDGMNGFMGWVDRIKDNNENDN
jgi:tetratricopeptide (TPR) repeat protein